MARVGRSKRKKQSHSWAGSTNNPDNRMFSLCYIAPAWAGEEAVSADTPRSSAGFNCNLDYWDDIPVKRRKLDVYDLCLLVDQEKDLPTI